MIPILNPMSILDMALLSIVLTVVCSSNVRSMGLPVWRVCKNLKDLNHGPLVWAPNLESLYTHYIPYTNKGPYF